MGRIIFAVRSNFSVFIKLQIPALRCKIFPLESQSRNLHSCEGRTQNPSLGNYSGLDQGYHTQNIQCTLGHILGEKTVIVGKWTTAGRTQLIQKLISLPYKFDGLS